MKLCQPGKLGPGSIVVRDGRYRVLSLVLVTCALILLAVPSSSLATAEEPVSHASPKKASHSTPSKKSTKTSFEDQPLDSSITQSASTAEKPAKTNSSGAIWRMLIGFAFVIGLIYAVHWLLKRYAHTKEGSFVSGATGVIDVLATTQLAPNRSLHLVRVGNDVVLIGATDHSITQLRTLDTTAATAAAVSAIGGEDFSRALQGALSSEIEGSLAVSQRGASTIIGMTTPAVPAADSDNEPFLKRVLSNMQLMTAR